MFGEKSPIDETKCYNEFLIERNFALFPKIGFKCIIVSHVLI